jgi:hypothetical protein
MNFYEPEQIDLPANARSLEFLQAVYQNPKMPLPVRMRAAMAALTFEVPKLSMVANVEGKDFASLLDARLARAKQVNGNKTIEHQPVETKKPVDVETKQPVEVKPPLPHVSDRRFRRV